MATEQDYYAVLGVKPTCSKKELKRAFVLKQREFHPDRKGTIGLPEAAAAAGAAREKTVLLNHAYQTLSSKLSRLEYDLDHGHRLRTPSTILELERLKRKQAEKQRENMMALAARSRDIETEVTVICEDTGQPLKHGGLLITKARYGALKPSVSLDGSTILTHSDSLDGSDSSSSQIIDVTEVIQSMVQHSATQEGGYVEIEDGQDKSLLPGFFDPLSSVLLTSPAISSGSPTTIASSEEEKSVSERSMSITKRKKHLEIEYMFARKYHYVRVENSEYLCIPSERHLVEVLTSPSVGSPMDFDDGKESAAASSASVDTDFTIDASDEIDRLIKQFQASTPTIGPLAVSVKQQDFPSTTDHISSLRTPDTSFVSDDSTELSSGEYLARQAGMNLSDLPRHSFATNAVNSTEPGHTSLPLIPSYDVVQLPSGQRALAAQPSLASLAKWKEDFIVLGGSSTALSRGYPTRVGDSSDRHSSSSVLSTHKYSILAASVTVGAVGLSMWCFYARTKRKPGGGSSSESGGSATLSEDEECFLLRWSKWVLSEVRSATDEYITEPMQSSLASLSPALSLSSLAVASPMNDV